MTAYLDALNPEQRRAVTHGTEDGATAAPPLLVIAGAGTGKTDTLAHRVAHLVLQGGRPDRMLLMTFSRRAASEMIRRVERIVGRVRVELAGRMAEAFPWSGTFHAVGARLLREHAEMIGLDPAFTIYDREDAADLMNLVRHEVGPTKTESRFPTKATCLAIYSRCVNAERPIEPTLAQTFPWCAAWAAELGSLFAAYVEAKQRHNVLDYDDLLLYWAQMMSEPALAAEIGARFDHVLVDEYQDTNRLQSSILTSLKPDGQGLTVVGDDAQAIYSFRAATIRNILDFPGQFEPPATIVKLERNYRSTQAILTAANAVIGLAPEGFAKSLWTDRATGRRPALITVPDDTEQARYVVDHVLENRERGYLLKQQAVLFRTSHHSATLELELARRNVPFVKFGGLKFLDAAHVKDLMGLLRLAENPRDRVAGLRTMLLVPGVGPATAKRALDRMDASTEPMRALATMDTPPRTGREWADLVTVLGELSSTRAPWPAELTLARTWYDPHLERAHEDVQARRADLAQLEHMAAAFPSRERFLTELTLDPPSATSDEAGVPTRDDDYLVLSTIHSAKGQEWRAVFVLDVVDGCIPSDLGTGSVAEIEEERRLLYVAMTRAKDELHLLMPRRFFTFGQHPQGDRHVFAARTRFLPEALLPHFEQLAWPPSPTVTGRAAAGTPRIDIRARMRAMWT